MFYIYTNLTSKSEIHIFLDKESILEILILKLGGGLNCMSNLNSFFLSSLNFWKAL